MSFDINKPFVTQGGKSAKLVFKSKVRDYSYLVIIINHPTNWEEVYWFNDSGKSRDVSIELINIPEPARKIEKIAAFIWSDPATAFSINKFAQKQNEIIDLINEIMEKINGN